jgi:vacuolar iron transporter family protein
LAEGLTRKVLYTLEIITCYKMTTDRLEKARSAYKKKDIEATKDAHSAKAIKFAKEEHTKEKGKYIGDLVYGALDGMVTTFAVVSGVEGAKLSSTIVLILGFANLFGDGVSMALGNYLSTKSEKDYVKKERERETWEVDNVPEGEREEIRVIFRKKGFEGKDLERAVKIITSDKKRWVDTMMHEELGLDTEEKNPLKSSLATFFAFVIAGLIPILSFILVSIIPGLTINTFFTAVILTAVALFCVGAMRSLVTGINWMRSGIEMLIVGSIAASAAYLVGFLLKGLGV